MRTVEQVLEVQRDHLSAADELVRRFSGDQSALREAALQWMDRASRSGAAPLGSGQPPGLFDDKGAQVFRLVEQATIGSEPLHELALRTRGQQYYESMREHRSTYDHAMLNLVIWLWPHRDRLQAWPDLVREWGRLTSEPSETEQRLTRGGRFGSVGAGRVRETALRLADFPDLAYGMIEPAMSDPRIAGDYFAACVGLRRLAGKPPHEDRDLSSVLSFGVRRILREYVERDAAGSHAFDELLGLVRNGRGELDWLWPEIESALGSEVEWPAAMAVMLAHGPHQDRAVGLLAEAVRGARSAVEPLERIVASGFYVREPALFVGPGWGSGRGREGLANKLLPLTRALMARGVWPVDLLKKCLRPARERTRGEPDDFAFERLRNLLAEGCLAVALDGAGEAEARRRALGGVERLSPGDESFRRALGKLGSAPAEVRDKAREVQRALERAPPADAELAVRDGCEVMGLEIVRGR